MPKSYYLNQKDRLFMLKKYFNKVLVKLLWKKKNRNNLTWIEYVNNEFLRDLIEKDGVVIGKGTYGQINVNYTLNKSEKLIVGDYCSIATTARFVLGGEHDYQCFSTYPFVSKIGHYSTEVLCKGPIILDDEVWVGENATILSGVHIGKGAVVAAGSVVVSDVPPYAIYGGNPAQLIKMRFPEVVVDKLLKCKLDVKRLDANTRWLFEIHLTEENVDEIIEKLCENKMCTIVR